MSHIKWFTKANMEAEANSNANAEAKAKAKSKLKQIGLGDTGRCDQDGLG